MGSPIHASFTKSSCFPVAGVFSSTLLPMLLRPQVISLICESATLFSQIALGSPRRFGFMTPISSSRRQIRGLPWVRRTASPYPVQLCKGSSRAALRGFGLDIETRLLASARSTPPYHLAGSLFATYTVLPHASSSRGITANAIALLVSPFRPERWAVFSCPLVSSHQDFGMYVMPGAHLVGSAP